MKYQGNDNHGRPKQNYVDKLGAMSDAALFEETKTQIWLSAYAANNPRSDYHWQCDATYDEWRKRNNVDQYGKAHKEVSKEVG